MRKPARWPQERTQLTGGMHTFWSAYSDVPSPSSVVHVCPLHVSLTLSLSLSLTVYLATAGQVEGKTRTQGQRGLWRACASVRMRVCLSVCACVGVSVYF